MWTYGYYDVLDRIDVRLGVAATMPAALSGLSEKVREMADDAEEYEMSNWDAIKSDISYKVREFVGYEDDPDMWEELSLFDLYGFEYYVMDEGFESDNRVELDKIDELYKAENWDIDLYSDI